VVVADKAVTPVIVRVEPLPEADKVPGNAVSLVSEAHVAVLVVWVALTKPLEPVQVVLSAPLKSIAIDVAPAPTVLN
jgi:hypothetical protein